MDIRHWLNQSVTLKKATGSDEYAQTTYGAGATIPARVEASRRLFRDAQGQEITAGSRIFTAVEVGPDDLLDDRAVIRVDPVPALDGSISHFEVYVL